MGEERVKSSFSEYQARGEDPNSGRFAEPIRKGQRAIIRNQAGDTGLRNVDSICHYPPLPGLHRADEGWQRPWAGQ